MRVWKCWCWCRVLLKFAEEPEPEPGCTVTFWLQQGEFAKLNTAYSIGDEPQLKVWATTPSSASMLGRDSARSTPSPPPMDAARFPRVTSQPVCAALLRSTQQHPPPPPLNSWIECSKYVVPPTPKFRTFYPMMDENVWAGGGCRQLQLDGYAYRLHPHK